jgi:hypothetical protein
MQRVASKASQRGGYAGGSRPTTAQGMFAMSSDRSDGLWGHDLLDSEKR